MGRIHQPTRREAAGIIGLGTIGAAYIGCNSGDPSPSAPSGPLPAPAFPADGTDLGNGVIYSSAEFGAWCTPIRRLHVPGIDGGPGLGVTGVSYGESALERDLNIANRDALRAAFLNIPPLTGDTYTDSDTNVTRALWPTETAFANSVPINVRRVSELGFNGLDIDVRTSGTTGAVSSATVLYGREELNTPEGIDLLTYAIAKVIFGPGESTTGGVLDRNDMKMNATVEAYAKIVYSHRPGETLLTR